MELFLLWAHWAHLRLLRITNKMSTDKPTGVPKIFWNTGCTTLSVLASLVDDIDIR